MHLIKDENGNLVQHGHADSHEHTHEHTHEDGVTHSHTHSMRKETAIVIHTVMGTAVPVRMVTARMRL